MLPGIVIDDGVGVLFINGEIKKVFTARKITVPILLTKQI